jgi:peptide-methionine (S)-S-oxide reductase
LSIDLATYGGGCFWCLEAVFQRLKGVEKVVSGYSGGHIKNPAYREVCEGTTGHAEVVQISFDSDIISFDDLLEIFWNMHDPTTLNKQGNDIGTQYRSVIFYHNLIQKQLAENSKIKFDELKIYNKSIVTEISEFQIFYAADLYHQNYYNDNSNQAYCSYVIAPKVKKLLEKYKNKIN